LTQVDPCIPVLASKPPAGAQGAHEIKHDGYRLTVRLFTRRGYDWTERFPGIVPANVEKGGAALLALSR
jgi:bifunctional non-homologous end joining protein LigD